ncbi:hypothetical protein ES319_D12G046800v1 [Gossypium barbadense]|uniref:Uncharacterized protein n=3 Tax=Gossypium TaxID=3633 RepID=A0A5J5NUK8_GOSBA|nr:hypothetical protein ES319_D12G046800v1 [Gossypium barbadense]TYG39864.1 hypothetical protein ES288_D12G049400v1 [Gossypium darwinii]TYH37532.1 hypothetical protein ES332_D12G047700v1 [Gossypium tomentosum]
MMFVIMLEEEFPIFSNSVIERMLNHEAREAFLSALVAEGLYRLCWLTNTSVYTSTSLIHWKLC